MSQNAECIGAVLDDGCTADERHDATNFFLFERLGAKEIEIYRLTMPETQRHGGAAVKHVLEW